MIFAKFELLELECLLSNAKRCSAVIVGKPCHDQGYDGDDECEPANGDINLLIRNVR